MIAAQRLRRIVALLTWSPFLQMVQSSWPVLT
jgi:hypothetical protein